MKQDNGPHVPIPNKVGPLLPRINDGGILGRVGESEVEELCRKILEEYEAMKRGPTGFALGTSKHAFIDARLKRVDSYHAELAKYVGDQKATITICELYKQVMG
jgi:hypothetical protein